MEVNMNNKFFILLLILTSSQLIYGLSQGPNVICCRQQERNETVSEECSKFDLQKCDAVLRDWDKTSQEWGRQNSIIIMINSLLKPEIITIFIIITSLIIWKFLKKKGIKK